MGYGARCHPSIPIPYCLRPCRRGSAARPRRMLCDLQFQYRQQESSSLQPSNSRTRTASVGWEAPEIEYALALGVVRWELQDDACPVALFNSILNCSSFDFFNSKFDHSFYSKIYTKYYFFCCGMFY